MSRKRMEWVNTWSWSSDSGAWPEVRLQPGRICAVPGCGAWADVEIRGLALCRDCAEAFARAYRRPRSDDPGQAGV